MKRIIYLILIILQLITIFSFSSENGKKSSGRSKKVVNDIINVYEKITNKSVDNEKVMKKMEYPIRKCAHFTLYFVLGILVILFLFTFNLKHYYLYAIIFVYLAALLDEFHQTFVSNRFGNITDTFIDISGCITSLLIIRLIRRKEND